MKIIQRAVRKAQRGFTAIEAIGVLIVGIIAIAYGVQYLIDYADTVSYQSTASQAKQVSDAASQYIKDNNAALVASATSTSPATITVAMLQNTHYLSSGFNSQNPFSQLYQIQVLQPVANTLEAMIVTTGGTAIPEIGVRKVAQLIGAKGGFISSSSTTVAKGSYGGWQATLSDYGVNPGAGHVAVALFFQNGALVSDYLYRNSVAGHPELNTMNTPLVLGTSVIVSSGNACTTNGALARDSNGSVLACVNLVWTYPGSKYWKDPVSTFTALPTTGNNTGDVRQTLDTARIFTWTGASWSALAVDQSGNLTVPNNLTVGGKAAVSGDVTAGGKVAATGDVSGNTLVSNLVVTAGSSCSGYQSGVQAKDASGMILSCQSGIWKSQSTTQLSGTWCGSTPPGGDSYGYPCQGRYPDQGCPSGYTVINISYGSGWMTRSCLKT